MGLFKQQKLPEASDFRKLNTMIGDLEKIKIELIPEEADKEMEKIKKAQLNKMGPWERKKDELTNKLITLKQHIADQQEIRDKMGINHRDRATIKLQMQNSKEIKECKELLSEMTKLLDKACKKRYKRLSPEELEQRYTMTELFGEELTRLAQKNARPMQGTDAEDDEIIARVKQNKTEQRREERQRRIEGRRRKAKERKGESTDDEAMGGPVHVSEQEQMFLDKVKVNEQEQDAILDQISETMNLLKELGHDINKELKTQQVLIAKVDEKMDKNNEELISANKKMKEILEASGGMTKWCPYLCCAIIVLALIAYIWNLIGF